MLVSLDPKTREQKILVDVMKLTGEQDAATLPQSKIHSQICFDANGVAWFGTHSYQWNTLEQFQKNPEAYSGGHLLTYDTKSGKATDLGILVPHESIMSLALAGAAGKVYCVMHPSGRFVVYDIATKKVSDKGAVLNYPCRTVVALRDGRGYTFTQDGHVVRYTLATDKLEVLGVAVPDENKPSADDKEYYNNPFALAVSPDQKHVYGVGWFSGCLFDYQPDIGPEGRLTALGPAFGDAAVPGVRKSLSIALGLAPDGRLYYAGYVENQGRVARYDPRTGKREYLGRMAVEGRPIGLANDAVAGALIVLRDGTVVVPTFDNKQTCYEMFRPGR
jgi:DNA-binding beta-propeller fold protein YncE